MENQIMGYLRESAKHWWTSLLVGLVAIVVGFWCIASPDITLVAMTILFIVAFLVTGVLDIAFAIANRKNYDGWGWNLAGGIIDILFAVILLALPLPVITTFLVYFIGFWIMFRSILTIGLAAEMNKFTSVGALLVLGIIALLFSLVYLISPVFGGVALVILVAMAFITYGAYRVYFAFKLKDLNKRLKKEDKKRM